MKKSTSIKRKILLVASSITAFIYIFWRLFFTIPIHHGMISLIAGLSLAIAETVGVIEAFSHYKNLSSNKEPEMPEIPVEFYPDVDVLIATHSESTEILYKTVNGCTHMKYPDKSKVHIYICDDTNRIEMKELADEMGVGYIGLAENKYAKAGNLNNALSKTTSPLIATFDADMIPRSDFLMKTVPYFSLPLMKKDADNKWVIKEEIDGVNKVDENYKVGFIQTPQSFYNPDLFQYNLYSEQNIPNEQDYFFKEVNVGRNRTNSPIYAGSNTLISREALEEVGGIAIKNITEDFATGIKIQSKGYKCFAISEVLAHGLAPADFKSLIKQRQRWGRGCVQTIRSFNFLFSNLGIRAKLSYITCFLYWTTFFRRFIYIISPILYSVFGLLIVECTVKELMFIWLPSYLLYNISLRYLSSNLRNQKWSNIVDTIIFPYLVIPIILETIGVTLRKFNVTSKERVSSKNVAFKYSVPHIILIVISVIGLVFSVEDLIKYKHLGNLVIIFWLVMNMYFLVMAVCFMLSRVNYRSEERYYTNLDVDLSFNERLLKATTSDISEYGMSFTIDTPEYIPYDEDIDISIKYLDYKANLKGRVVHVDKFMDKWKYSIKLNHLSQKDKNEYYQIVYDRGHTLATEMKSNTIKEMKSNTIDRNRKHKISNRKLPRIPVKVNVNTTDGNIVEVVNFNYEYILLKGKLDDKNINLKLKDDLSLNCSKCDKATAEDNTLYQIENWENISNDESLREMVLSWAGVLENKEELANV